MKSQERLDQRSILISMQEPLLPHTLSTDSDNDALQLIRQRTPQAWQYVLCVVASVLNASMCSLLQIYSAYEPGVQKTFGLDEMQSNALYSAMNFAACMFAWMPGFAFDAYGPVVTGALGGTFSCIGLGLCLLHIHGWVQLGNAGLLFAFFVFGIGATFHNLNGALACLKCFPAECAGAASACVLCSVALFMTVHSWVYEAFFADDFEGFICYEIACSLVAALTSALVFGPLCGNLVSTEVNDEQAPQTPRTPQQSSGDQSPVAISFSQRLHDVGPRQVSFAKCESPEYVRHISPNSTTASSTSGNNFAIDTSAPPLYRGMVDSCPGTPGGAGASKATSFNNWLKVVVRKVMQGPSSMSKLGLPSTSASEALLSLARVEWSEQGIQRAGLEDDSVRDLRRTLRDLLPQRQISCPQPDTDFGYDLGDEDAMEKIAPPPLHRCWSAPDMLRTRNFPGVPTFAEMAQPGAFRREHLEDEALTGSDISGPEWADELTLTPGRRDFWDQLAPQVPLKEVFVERLRLMTKPKFIFLAIVFIGPVAWVFAYLGVVAGLGTTVGMQAGETVRLTECLGVASAAGRLLLGVPPDFIRCVRREAFVIFSVMLMLIGTMCVLVSPSIGSLWFCSNLVMFGYGGILALVPGCLRAGLGTRYVGFLYSFLYFVLAIALVPWNWYAVEGVGCTTLEDCYGAWLQVSAASSMAVVCLGLLFIWGGQ